MRKSLLITCCLLSAGAFGQTNKITDNGNIGLGTYTPRVQLDVLGKTIIQNALGTLDYVNTAQHNGQIRILNGLGSYGTRALEFALLDDGKAVIQANEQGIGYNPLLLNPVLGNVGIGTTTPGYRLDVNGQGRFLEGVLVPDGRPFGVVSTIGAQWANNTLIYKGYITNIGDYSEILVPGGLANTANIRLLQNGNVGIGITVPDAKLAVNGTIHAKEVKIDLSGWPDYVFNPLHKLTSLKDIKSYINQNHHLPDVPSEKEMVEKGINVAEMNVLLMKKIEELTLLLIKQEERFDAQDERINKQAAEIQKLKNK